MLKLQTFKKALTLLFVSFSELEVPFLLRQLEFLERFTILVIFLVHELVCGFQARELL